MSDFIHLHNHTEYSLLDGLSKINDLITRCHDYKMDALAITDHGGMYGVIKFYLSCKEAGLKPIIGEEFYIAQRSRFDKQAHVDSDQYHLVLLAKNFTGYKNLMKLTTIAHIEGFYYKPRIDKEVLKKHKEGLICLSACLEGEIPHLLRMGEEDEAERKAREYLEIFGDDFYLEIQKHKIKDQDIVNEKIIELSRRLGIPLVATNDCHYVDADDAEAQEALLCVQTQTTLQTPNRKISMIDSPDFYFRSPSEMKGLFLQYPEAIENTVKIAEKCNLEIPMGKWILPVFPVPEGETPESYLKKLAFQSLKYRYQNITEDLKKRLNYELDVICKKGFATYFLIVADFVNWAKEKGIRVGPGRGSVAGSLVAYVLRITSIDPIVHNLPFERFMNPERPSPPDIDLDFADDRRDEVISYVTEKYGKEKVAQIITFGTMEARQSIRDIGRVMGFPYAIPDKIAKLIPPGAQGFPMTIEKALGLVPELLQIYQTDEKMKKLMDLAMKVEGVARHASTHAAGIVIADKPLTEYTPLQKEVKGERIVTQYDMYSLDLNVAGEGRAIGLLKMDFLGLRNLTILEKAMVYVKELKGINIDISSIPLDDKKVFEMISAGETTGVFQLESGGMRRLAKNLKPSKFSDLAAMVALFRPGPMEWIDDFIAAKKNIRAIKYPHPDLKPILSETYGIAVYQEQCLQIANIMAGYTMGEADNLRRAIGKKKKEMMEKEKVKFIKKAVEKGYSKKTAENVFSLIERFAGYGFNKAHATSYAMIAYQTAYMKVHFPVEFMAAVLTAESGAGAGPTRDEKVALVVEECRRMGIPIFGPDVNKSDTGFTIEKFDSKEAIRFGLSAIKNVGTAAISAILEARKNGEFTSLFDFCRRVDLQKVNKKTLESLIKAGAMDIFGKRAAMLSILPKVIEEGHRIKQKESLGQSSLFDNFLKEEKRNNSYTLEEIKIPDIEEFSNEELSILERDFLGFYLRENPATNSLSLLKDYVDYEIGELEDKGLTANNKIRIGGIITSIRVITTKKNNSEMAFVRIKDKSGIIELTFFPKVYNQYRHSLIKDQVIRVTGRLEKREKRISQTESLEENSLIVETVEVVNEDFFKEKVLTIEIPKNFSKGKLEEINTLLRENPGKDKVIIIFKRNGVEKKITVPFGVLITEDLKSKINRIINS